MCAVDQQPRARLWPARHRVGLVLVVKVLDTAARTGLADDLRRRAVASSVPVLVLEAETPTHIAGLVVATAGSDAAQSRISELDVVVGPGTAEMADLWQTRLEPFARRLADGRFGSAPATLTGPNAEWGPLASRKLDRLRAALAALEDTAAFDYQHIGSTAVPGLMAKPIVDLQICLPALPERETVARLLAPAGYLPAAGSRPDSPGVYQDVQRGRHRVTTELLRKQLYVCPDPGAPAILHLRQHGSPFARHTVLLRDRLRNNATDRATYQDLKLELAARHARDTDYDDYTRGKSQFIAELANKIDDARGCLALRPKQ